MSLVGQTAPVRIFPIEGRGGRGHINLSILDLETIRLDGFVWTGFG